MGGLTRSFSTVGRAFVQADTERESGDSTLRDTTDRADPRARAEPGGTTESEPLTPEQVRRLAVEAIRAQRDALLEARSEGLFSSVTLEHALDHLDTEEIMLTGGH